MRITRLSFFALVVRFTTLFVLCALFSACVSSERVTAGMEEFSAATERETARTEGFPAWLNETPPEDAIWGIGCAFNERQSLSMQRAEELAENSVRMLLGTYMDDLFAAYGRITGAVPNEALLSDVKNKTAYMPLDDAVVNIRAKTADGAWWYRTAYPKASAREFFAFLFEEEHTLFPEFDVTAAREILDTLLAQNDPPVQAREIPNSGTGASVS